jgi:hypothetical protein
MDGPVLWVLPSCSLKAVSVSDACTFFFPFVIVRFIELTAYVIIRLFVKIGLEEKDGDLSVLIGGEIGKYSIYELSPPWIQTK